MEGGVEASRTSLDDEVGLLVGPGVAASVAEAVVGRVAHGSSDELEG